MKKSILLIFSSFVLLSATIYGQSLDSLIKKTESGDSSAQLNLAKKYLNGQGVSSDTAKAFYWYKKVLNRGMQTHSTILPICTAQGKAHNKI